MTWLTTAWEFIKKNAVALGLFLVALLGFLFGVSIKKTPVIVSGKDPKQQKEEDDLKKAEQQLDAQAAKDKEQATEQHDKDITAVVSKEQAAEPSLEKNEDATNNYLKEIGSQVKGGSDGGQQ